MKCLWTHNFPPEVEVAGVWMFELGESMRSLGIDVGFCYLGDLRKPSDLIRAIGVVRRESRDVDIVHAQFGSACGYVTSFAATPKLVSFRGSDLLGCTWGKPRHRLHGHCVRQLNRRAISSYDSIVVMSNRMSHELAEYYDYRREVRVVPSGINLSQFVPMSRKAARDKLGCADDTKPWVLFSSVGGLGSVTKRGDLAKSAMDLVREKIPDAQLKVLTDVPRELVPYWVNASDVILLTSPREGWPNIIKEGLACNVPFVATDVSDLKEIASRVATCFVCDPNATSLSRALVNVLDSEVTENLRELVSFMEIDNTAKRLVDLYESLAMSSKHATGSRE